MGKKSRLHAVAATSVPRRDGVSSACARHLHRRLQRDASCQACPERPRPESLTEVRLWARHDSVALAAIATHQPLPQCNAALLKGAQE